MQTVMQHLSAPYHHHIALGEPQLTLIKNGIKDVIKCFGDEINIYAINEQIHFQ